MKNKWFICYFFIVFIVGWTAHSIYANNFMDFSNALPTPYKILESDNNNNNNNNNNPNNSEQSISETNPSETKSESLLVRFFLGDNERNSPGDRIKEEQIHVYDDKIVIDLQDATWSSFVDTNSMDPIFDKGTNGIEVMPKTPYDIKVGDVISYEYVDKKTGEVSIIAHRVVEIGYDSECKDKSNKQDCSEGIYYIAKGDNNIIKDPYKVRFEQVRGVLVGLIY
ncbi:MAG: hypothetical protein ABIG89_03625 [Candidatus Woesearchaeota archaeon]